MSLGTRLDPLALSLWLWSKKPKRKAWAQSLVLALQTLSRIVFAFEKNKKELGLGLGPGPGPRALSPLAFRKGKKAFGPRSGAWSWALSPFPFGLQRREEGICA